MKQTLVALSLAFLPLSVAGASAIPARARPAQPIVATVTLPQDSVLPGVPFDIVVTLTNVSNRRATAGLIATLVVTFPDGRTVAMQRPDGNDQWLLEPHNEVDTSIELAPGESVQRVAGWDHGSIPNWFHYDSFAGPGTYEIALELSRGSRDSNYNDHINYVGALRAPSVPLERAAPAGEDESLWERMQQTAGGHWADNAFVATKSGVALADEIIQLHPASGYYPYALALRALSTKKKELLSPLREAVQRFRDSPAYPYLVKAVGDTAFYQASLAERLRDVSSANDYYALAETYYREALKTDNLAIRAGPGGAERGLRNTLDHREKSKVR